MFSAGNSTVANVLLQAIVDGGLLRSGNFSGTALNATSDSSGLITLEFSSSTTGVFTLTLISGTQTEQVYLTVTPFVAGMTADIIGGNSTVDQGNGSTPDTFRQILLTAYDSNFNGVGNATVSFSCDSVDDLCIFSPASYGVTDSNGYLSVNFTSWRGGFKTVTFTYASITTEISFDVAQILSCDNSQFISASNSSSPYIGLDSTTMITTVLDLNRDPIPNIVVGITGYDDNFYYYQSTFLSDNNGQVFVDGQANPGPMFWFATIDGCANQIAVYLTWSYPIDCGASYFVSPTSGFTLTTSDILDVEAHFVPLAGGNESMYNGAFVRLSGWHDGGWYDGISMDSNGNAAYNLSFSSGQDLVQNITLTVDDTTPTCTLAVLVTYVET